MSTKKSLVGSVLQFSYQGSHSHPVWRLVVVKEDRGTYFMGYEIQEGKIRRTSDEAKAAIKTYRKDRIAKYGDYCRLYGVKKNRSKKPHETTLTTLNALSLIEG